MLCTFDCSKVPKCVGVLSCGRLCGGLEEMVGCYVLLPAQKYQKALEGHPPSLPQGRRLRQPENQRFAADISLTRTESYDRGKCFAKAVMV